MACLEYSTLSCTKVSLQNTASDVNPSTKLLTALSPCDLLYRDEYEIMTAAFEFVIEDGLIYNHACRAAAGCLA